MWVNHATWAKLPTEFEEMIEDIDFRVQSEKQKGWDVGVGRGSS